MFLISYTDQQKQALAVRVYNFLAFIGFYLFPVYIGLMFTRFYWILIVYVLFIYADRKTPYHGGRSSTWLKKWSLWKHVAGYFPARLVKTCDLPSDRNYIFGLHPHGLMVYATSMSFATEALNFSELFPGLRARVCALAVFFWLPIQRELGLWLGLCSVTRESVEHLLTNEGTGNALVVLPGGSAEAMHAFPRTTRLILNNRKGFVRMALRHGADLVPVLSFGENDVFSRTDEEQVSQGLKPTGIAKFFAKFHMTMPQFHGKNGLPYQKAITTIVGRPLPVEKVNGEPTKEQVNAMHAIYIQELTKMYEENKALYGYEDVPLEIM